MARSGPIVQLSSGTITVGGTVAVTDNNGALTVDDGNTTLSVDDGAGSLTVDGTVSVAETGTTIVRSALTAATADQSVIAAPGDGSHIVVLRAKQINTHATNNGSTILKDGATAKVDLQGTALGRDDFSPKKAWHLSNNTALLADTAGAGAVLLLNVEYYVSTP